MSAAAFKQSAQLTRVGDTTLVVEREFDAPAHLVYRACTEPELVSRWFHANRAEGVSAEIDLRVGGRYRYVSRLSDGSEFAFSGEFLEIVPNERIVQTECFEAIPGACSTNTMTLTERDGATLMRVEIEHPTKEGLDAQIASGMEAGMQDAYDLLDEVALGLV